MTERHQDFLGGHSSLPRCGSELLGNDQVAPGSFLTGPSQGDPLEIALAYLGQAGASLGLAEVELYVDGDNTAARRTYTRLGFRDTAVHAQYGT